MNNPPVASHQVLQQAAAWYALLRSERATEQDHLKWQRWHEQHAEHRQAWSLVERVGGRFGQFADAAQKQGAMAALQAGAGPRISRRRTLLSLGGLGLASWLGWQTFGASAYVDELFADYSTRTGEHRQFKLADGGQLWLNTQSAVDVNASGRIQLLTGEILLDDRQRQGDPLRVHTPFGDLSAQRGLFNLRLGDASLCIDAYASAVDVLCNGQRLRVLQGQQVTLGQQGPGPLLPANEAHRAWVHGVMVADGITLAAVVAELARYRHGYLGCDPAIGQWPVVGTFSIRDTDRALAALASALPLRISRLMPWWVTLEARA